MSTIPKIPPEIVEKALDFFDATVRRNGKIPTPAQAMSQALEAVHDDLVAEAVKRATLMASMGQKSLQHMNEQLADETKELRAELKQYREALEEARVILLRTDEAIYQLKNIDSVNNTHTRKFYRDSREVLMPFYQKVKNLLHPTKEQETND